MGSWLHSRRSCRTFHGRALHLSLLTLLIIDLIIALIFTRIYVDLYPRRASNIIVLGISPEIKDYFKENRSISFYILSSDNLNFIYYAEKIVIITHSARLPDGRIIVALNEEPDITSLYIIEVNDNRYRAVPLEQLAKIIYADSVLLATCDLDENAVVQAFSGHAKNVYYYKCSIAVDEAMIDIQYFISNKTIVNECLVKITLTENTDSKEAA